MKTKPNRDRLISFRITEDGARDLEWISDQKYVPLSHTLREAVRLYRAKHQDMFEDAYIQRNHHHGANHW